MPCSSSWAFPLETKAQMNPIVNNLLLQQEVTIAKAKPYTIMVHGVCVMVQNNTNLNETQEKNKTIKRGSRRW